MAGVYVEALTIVKDAKMDKDEIFALTARVLKSEVVSQKNYVSGDGFGIEVVVKIIVDSSVLEGRVKKLLQDRTHLEQLNQARKKEKALLDKIAILETENRRLMAKKESSKDLKKQFEEASRGITAVDWVNVALLLFDGEKFTDPQKAIEWLNEAIRLNPDYADAYNYRGGVYSQLGQYDRAIQDNNEAIRLTPNYFWGFYFRGDVYVRLKQYQRAIEDYNEVIRLNPSLASVYSNRGAAYLELKQYQRAIEDFSEHIRLKPKDAEPYFGRGNAYSFMDCTPAVRQFLLGQSGRGSGLKTVLQTPRAAGIRERNAAVCGCTLPG